MELTYKPLGDFIHEVDVRNNDLSITKLMGVNLNKEMMPSVANIIDTDLSKYKVVTKNQFVCKLMSVGRDACLPIALKKDDEPVIISSAYYAFEVKNINEILPEYLFMCFLRPIFDKELWFKTGGDVRGGITWDDFCATKIPYISIEEQFKFVHDYKVITDRILLLEKINNNLLEINQCILSEFMLKEQYNLEELSKIADIIDCLHSKKPEYYSKGTKQLLQLENIKDNSFLDLSYRFLISDSDYSLWTKRHEIKEGDCVITNVGRIGAVAQAPYSTAVAMGRNMSCITLKNQFAYPSFLITILTSNHIKKEIIDNTDVGTIMGALNVSSIPKLKIPFFKKNVFEKLEDELAKPRKMFIDYSIEIARLNLLKSELLIKISKETNY